MGDKTQELDYQRAEVEQPRRPMHAGCAGALIGAGLLGCLAPLLLAIYCALVLNDMGGPLGWPILAVFGAMLGLVVGGIVGGVVEIVRMRRSRERPMPRGARVRWIILLIILIPSALLAAATARTGYWYLGFRQQMRMAEAHALVVQRALEADGRFPDVRVYEHTSNQGLLVTGDVPPGQAHEVRGVVESTMPPVPVEYDLPE